ASKQDWGVPKNMTRFALLAGTAAMCLSAAAPAIAEEEIGFVFEREYRGAEGMRVSGETRDLRWHGPIYSEETVRTESGERTELEFADSTRISVGENSEVVLDSFVYDPAQNSGDAVISFGKGVFRFVTGDMEKDGFTLNTPSATLAIRGTIFVLKIDAVNNVTVYVEEGAVEIFPCGGEPALVQAGEYGLTPANCTGVSVRDGNPIFDDPGGERRDDNERYSDDSSEGGNGNDVDP